MIQDLLYFSGGLEEGSKYTQDTDNYCDHHNCCHIMAFMFYLSHIFTYCGHIYSPDLETI